MTAIAAITAIPQCAPWYPLSSGAFGPRKRKKIGSSTLWLTAFPFPIADVLVRVISVHQW
jgi:hypothetical protein